MSMNTRIFHESCWGWMLIMGWLGGWHGVIYDCRCPWAWHRSWPHSGWNSGGWDGISRQEESKRADTAGGGNRWWHGIYHSW